MAFNNLPLKPSPLLNRINLTKLGWCYANGICTIGALPSNPTPILKGISCSRTDKPFKDLSELNGIILSVFVDSAVQISILGAIDLIVRDVSFQKKHSHTLFWWRIEKDMDWNAHKGKYAEVQCYIKICIHC